MFEIGTATDYSDLATRLNTFLTNNGSAFGLSYAGTGNGTFTAYRGGASSLAETFTITATSATSFTVVGSSSGNIGTATVGTPFSTSKLAFTITAGGTAFIAGDVFTISTAPKWTNNRLSMGVKVTATQSSSGQYAAQNLVDGKIAKDDNRVWRVDNPITLPQDIQFDLYQSKSITSYEVGSYFSAIGGTMYAPKTWTFDYWNGSAWVTLDTQTNITSWGEDELKVFTIGSPVSATRFRLHITAVIDPFRVMLGRVKLMGGPGTTRDHCFGNYLWKAPGNNGTDAIYVGIHMFERADVDYYNWEICGFDGFSSVNASFYQQPGCHRKAFLPLWSGSTPYWFICDGRRAIVIAKVNAQYEMAVLGFADPYFTPAQLPYPLVIGAPLAFGETLPLWNDALFRWSNLGTSHRMPTHSDSQNTSSPVPATIYQLRLRNVDGSYDGYEATANDSVATTPDSTRNLIHPYRCGLSGQDPNIDGTYDEWPVMLILAAPDIPVQLPGIVCVTGQGISPETLLRKGSIDWLVLPNITRTDRDDFLAVALD